MKKYLFAAVLLLIGITAYSQEEQNGTIYIKHPYIDVMNNAVKSYLNKDEASLKNLYSDTATYWVSGFKDFIPMAEAYKLWWADFDKYDNIKMTQIGYPDYLHYKKDNSRIVQSWWTWAGTSKEDGSELKITMVIYGEFNDAGKIFKQYMIGDFPKP